jgi:hypothetical protein
MPTDKLLEANESRVAGTEPTAGFGEQAGGPERLLVGRMRRFEVTDQAASRASWTGVRGP